MPPAIHTFVLPAIAFEAIGAHLPTFPQKLVLGADDVWDVARQADGAYMLRCSREAATNVGKLLQAAGRTPVASVERTTACIEGAGLIITQLRHEDRR